MNVEEKMFEMAQAVASLAASVEATSNALERHETVCAERYGLQLKIFIGGCAGVIGALGSLSFLLLQKVM